MKIRSSWLEFQILEALSEAKEPSTAELVRILHRNGLRVNRQSVRTSLRALEAEGDVEDRGGQESAWSRREF
jgi:DNA-binding PadR family transcriptional regulator